MVAYVPASVDISVQQHNTIISRIYIVTINGEHEAVNCMSVY